MHRRKCRSLLWAHRERNAGWYGSGVYLAHKMFEEIALAAIQTLPLSCILFFPIQLHGSWLFFWLTYVTISTVAIGGCACVLT